MTEAEIYRLLATPLVLAIYVLSFSKAAPPKRVVAAAPAAAAGVAIGLLGLWATRAGAPWWTGWILAAFFLAIIFARTWAARGRVQDKQLGS